MILENTTAKILDFDRSRKLHPSKICMHTICKRLHDESDSIKYCHKCNNCYKVNTGSHIPYISNKVVLNIITHVLCNFYSSCRSLFYLKYCFICI